MARPLRASEERQGPPQQCLADDAPEDGGRGGSLRRQLGTYSGTPGMNTLAIVLWVAAQAGVEPYRLKPLEFPPENTAQRVSGELTRIDAFRRSGELRVDGSGESREFALLPFGNAAYLGAEADLRELPIGTHVTVLLYADQKGQPTRASNLLDDFSMS